MLTWILLGLALWIVGFGFVMVLMRMASDEDRGSRRIERSMDPFSNVPATQFGSGGGRSERVLADRAASRARAFRCRPQLVRAPVVRERRRALESA